MQHGGRLPFWKSLNCHISVKNRSIMMKFSTLYQILNPVAVTWPKIERFEIQDDGGHHLEIRFFGHYSSTDCPISAKFCTRKQNGMLSRATAQKMQMCKIQHGGRPPIWKSLNGHISVNKNLAIRQQIVRQLRTPYAEGIYKHKYYTVTLKSRLRVTQGHWKRNHWIDHTRLRSSRVIWRWIILWP